MDVQLKQEIKLLLKTSIRAYFKRQEKKFTYHVLNHIFPNERKIRYLIGGLETSLGTTFWEPITKKLAQFNGFEILSHKLLTPEPFPSAIRLELDTLINEREKNPRQISTDICIVRLRNAALNSDLENLNFVSPPRGSGVDIYLKKDNIEYAFDTKTAQPNQNGFKSFNKQLLEWYAYRFAKDPNVNFKARIAIPFNPFKKDWYEHQKSMLSGSPLDIENDLWVGNEFWDFISGIDNTWEQLKLLFIELGNENFSDEFNDIFYDSPN